MQIYLILVLVLIVPTFIVAYFSISNTFSYAEEEIANSSLKNIETVSNANEMMLFNVIKNTLRLTQNSLFKDIKGINTYEELNSNYTNIQKAKKAEDVFSELLYNDDSIHSAFFIMENGDYVMSSDRGIVKMINYRELDWLDEVLSKKKTDSISGIWESRTIRTATVEEINNGIAGDYYVDVLSYIYSLKSVGSSIRGTIVVNVYEKSVCEYLNPKTLEQSRRCILINKNNEIISSTKKDELGISIENKLDITKILNSEDESGYFFDEESGERMLYTYYKTDFSNWIYVLENSLDELMLNVRNNYKSLVFIVLLLIVIGAPLLILLVYKMSKPFKELVLMIRKNEKINLPDDKNELIYLSDAFKKIQSEGKRLSCVLKEKELEARRLAIRELMNGDAIKKENLEELKTQFPFNHFMVILAGFDNKEDYLKTHSSEERTYFRYMVNQMFEKQFNIDRWKIKGVHYSSTVSGAIINIECFDQTKVPKIIKEKLLKIKKDIFELVDYTVTIGVSLVHNDINSIKSCTFEANEAIKQKIIKGNNSIIFWEAKMQEQSKYYFPYNSSQRISNYIKVGDLDNIKKELSKIRKNILSNNNISYDNILLIYNQLIGATIRILVEKNLNTSLIFGNYGNIYDIISKKDTIDEIEEYLVHFYTMISNYLKKEVESNSTNDYGKKILDYIDTHYQEDILFEEMADEIGISYSYMRKITKEITGRGLIDCINKQRIEKAKELLIKTERNISDIAIDVGYNNVQSINRFFKKYEGISPGDYRNEAIQRSIASN